MTDRMLKAVQRFFFKPATAVPLAVLRIGIALTLLGQAWVLRDSVLNFLASDGFIQGELARFLTIPYTPRISWLVTLLTPYGVGETTVIYAVGWLYVLSLVFLCFGLFTRSASILAWLLHWVLITSGYATIYGIDYYAHAFLFYLMWMPSGDALSLDVAFERRSSQPSTAARLSLRVIQLHLCVSYLSSGIEKASGAQWWNGELLWRALSLPVYSQFDMSWLVNYPLLSKAAGWSTLVLELGYFIFIWPKRTRKFWVVGIVGLHLGIVFFLGLTLFGVIMSLLTIAAFGFSAEPPGERRTVPRGILLFDGVCNVCNAFVTFVYPRDTAGNISFASLQSEVGRKLLADSGYKGEGLDSMVLLVDGRCLDRSTGILNLFRWLRFPWPLLYAFIVIPRPVRDWAYTYFAKHRYQWFGKKDQCMIPSPELKHRFID